MTISSDGDRPGPVAPEVIAYYERSDEAARLDTSIGLVERKRTRALLRRLLPPPPATVLDVGGGTGVHAVWLAQLGYHTHLSDPVAKHIDEARSTADREGVSLALIRLGHAGDLPHADDSVDAVVALGPLYHLPQPRGNVHASLVLINDLVRINSRSGHVTPLLNEDDGLWNPASVTFGRGSDGRRTLYITNYAVLPPVPDGNLGPAVLTYDVGAPGKPIP